MKKGVSLIELVFAIVIIGIAAMSFPLILTQTSNNIRIALQQEAILNAKAHASIILSHPWDENTVDPSTGRLMVLDTTGTKANNAFNDVGTDLPRRAGHIDDFSGRRAFRTQIAKVLQPTGGISIEGEPIGDLIDKIVPVVPTVPNSGEWGAAATIVRDDVDDFNGFASNLVVTPDVLDFILNFTLSSNVMYVTDSPIGAAAYGNTNINFNFATADAGGTTNIKMIQVTAASVADNINVVLRAYSSNIGDYELLERVW